MSAPPADSGLPDSQGSPAAGFVETCEAPQRRAAASGAMDSTVDTTPSDPRGPQAPTDLRWIGRYQVLGELGRGGMGVVYLARDSQLDRKVAVKQLLGGNERRLYREALAMAKLSHPNAIPIYEIVAGFDSTSIVMEFVEGQTLRAWQATPRSYLEVLAVYKAAARGLIAAHQKRLVHRDFKPKSGLMSQVPKNTRFSCLHRGCVPSVYQAEGPVKASVGLSMAARRWAPAHRPRLPPPLTALPPYGRILVDKGVSGGSRPRRILRRPRPLDESGPDLTLPRMPFRDEDRNPPKLQPVEPSPTLEEVYGVLQAAKKTDTPWWSRQDILMKLPPPPTLARAAAAIGGHGLNTNNTLLAIGGLLGLSAIFANETTLDWELAALKTRSEQVQAHLNRLVEEGRVEPDKIAGVRVYRAL